MIRKTAAVIGVKGKQNLNMLGEKRQGLER